MGMIAKIGASSWQDNLNHMSHVTDQYVCSLYFFPVLDWILSAYFHILYLPHTVSLCVLCWRGTDLPMPGKLCKSRF